MTESYLEKKMSRMASKEVEVCCCVTGEVIGRISEDKIPDKNISK